MAWFCGWEACLSGGRRTGSPPQVAWLNICPPPLGCLDTSTQPPSHHSSVPLRSGESWHGQPGRAPNPRQKVSPRCQRSRKFNNLERMGFAFLKPLGQHLGSHTHTKWGTGEKKTLSNGLCASQWFGERNPQNSTSGLCRLLWVSVPYSLPFFPHSHGRVLIAYDSD